MLVLTRWCECDLGSHRCRVNSSPEFHCEGCRWSTESAPLRVKRIRFRVVNETRWEVVRAISAGIFFYLGLTMSSAGDFGTSTHRLGGLLMAVGAAFILSLCRIR